MKAVHLIRDARSRLAQLPTVAPGRAPFARGGRWMAEQAAVLYAVPLRDVASYTRYGWLKYGLSTGALLLSGTLLLHRSVLLLPLAALAFYAVEILFAFLFPILAEGRPRPLRTSVRATLRAGYFRVGINTMIIAAYMLSGLLHPRRPLHRWHIGCLAILTWYHDEIRIRL